MHIAALGSSFAAGPSIPPQLNAAARRSGLNYPSLLAKALGRHGISNDMSADYCRLATWRTNDEGELARAMQVEKPAAQVPGQTSLLDLFDEEATA